MGNKSFGSYLAFLISCICPNLFSKCVKNTLKHEGVSVVFGYPGGAALNIYDETYKQNYFTHILTRHEQAAVHAADGYARATGKVGVAFVTSGPGFTNAVTGLATAYADSACIHYRGSFDEPAIILRNR